MARSQHLISNARELRTNSTFSESKLWQILRGSKLGGKKFRRQYSIGTYIADFCCVSERVIVELDGDSHLGKSDYDREREAYLVAKGYRIVRFENFEVMLDENRVVEKIVIALGLAD